MPSEAKVVPAHAVRLVCHRPPLKAAAFWRGLSLLAVFREVQAAKDKAMATAATRDFKEVDFIMVSCLFSGPASASDPDIYIPYGMVFYLILMHLVIDGRTRWCFPAASCLSMKEQGPPRWRDSGTSAAGLGAIDIDRWGPVSTVAADRPTKAYLFQPAGLAVKDTGCVVLGELQAARDRAMAATAIRDFKETVFIMFSSLWYVALGF